MKVLHYAPSLEPGSPDELAVDLAFALQAYEVSSIVASPSKKWVAPILSEKIRYARCKSESLIGLWGRSRNLRELIRRYSPDIVQAYGYDAIAVATRACSGEEGRQHPHLIGVLSTYPHDVDFAERTGLLECDAITMIRPALRNFLKSIHPSLIKSWIIPYGVNELQFFPSYKPTDTWKERWFADRADLAGSFTICLPAPLDEQSRTRDIIPILSLLRSQDIPAHALLTGSLKNADPSYLRELHHKLRAAELEDHVTFLDEPENLRDILSVSNAVLCLTDKPVVYHRTALQALALGKPTAGYGHGAVLEYLEAMQPMGVLPVGDYEAAADLLSQWYSSPPDGIDDVPFPYKLSDTAKKYNELYTQLTQA